MYERGPIKSIARRIVDHFTRPSSGVDFSEQLSKREIRSGVVMKKNISRKEWERMGDSLREVDAITAIAREGINPENEVFSAIWSHPPIDLPKEIKSAIERIEDVQREELGPDYQGSLPIPTFEQISRARLYARTEALMTLIDWKVDDHVTVSHSGLSHPCRLEAKDREYELQEVERKAERVGGREIVEEVTLTIRKKSDRPAEQPIEPLPSFDNLR